METKSSKMEFYSLGVVSENKALDSFDIEVTLIEKVPMTDGELTGNVTTKVTKSQTADGKPYQVTTKTTNTVKATWFPLGMSNRRTAPDVRRGAEVAIYRFADTDQYFWVTGKDDVDLRKLETVVYAYSGTKDESQKTTANNSYYIEISTHQGHIIVHTSKSNEEPFGYDIQLNTKEGFFQMQDDIGNLICLTSAQNQIQMVNQNGSFFNMLGPNISINAVNTYSVKAPNINMQSSNGTWNSNNLTITAQTQHNGNITVAGELQATTISATSITAPTFTGNLDGNAATASAIL